MTGLDECLGFTLREEGGFVDDPRDPGGATNMGVTLATYRAWSGNPEADAAQLRALPRSLATCIYGAGYWNPVRADALPDGIDLLVFDFAVTSGTMHSARELQAALRMDSVEIDGSIGPDTLSAVRKADVRSVIATLATRQGAFYRALPTFHIFGEGWLGRNERRRIKALAMAGAVR